METQFDDERNILQLFRKAWPAFPKGRLIKTESPDFILRTSRKSSIGIEITRIDTPTSGKKFNSIDANGLLNKSSTFTETNGQITKDFLESTIQRKEQKLSLYRRHKSDAYWLIITAGTSIQVDDKPLQNFPEWNFETKFDKLFLLEFPVCRIVVLK
jgi:hypothetical protein